MIKTFLIGIAFFSSISSFSQDRINNIQTDKYLPDSTFNSNLDTNNIDYDKIHEYVEIGTKPEFPGGEVALLKFIFDNIIYPEDSRKSKQEGRVYAKFTIDETGNVRDVEILRGLNAEIDAEVVSVLKKMPQWSPGIVNGKPESVSFAMPIKFTLD